MSYNPKLHHRRSIRLKGYDYRQVGAYFLTIVTQQRVCCFGDVDERGELNLNRFGKLIVKCWQAIPTHARHVELDAFVVMPNHFHGIVWIMQDIIPPEVVADVPSQESPPSINGTTSGSINAIVQNFKSVSTRKLNQLARTPKAIWWQRDYYESIIRNEAHLTAIRNYVDTNPANWHLDRERPFDPNNGLWF